jgi:hypothetical protein
VPYSWITCFDKSAFNKRCRKFCQAQTFNWYCC